MILIQQVSHYYDKTSVLKGINLELTEDRIGIVGSNGSGKSTFARLLNGLVAPSEGKVLVDNACTQKDKKQVRKKVGFVFQNPDNQIVMPIVEEDLAFGLKNQAYTKVELQEKVEWALKMFDLWDLKQQPSHTLSGGQKQLLAIAGVCAMEPEIIVFDEPTTLLDLRNQRKIKKLMQTLKQQLVVVSHDLSLLADFDRVLVIEGGQVILDDLPSIALTAYEALHQE